MMYIFFAFILCGLLYMLWENTHFTVTNYEYKNSRVPEEMDGLRILQISDLHNQSFGKENHRLLEAIKGCEADVIMITGDLIDSTFTNVEKALTFAQELVKLAPVYYDEAIPFRGGTLVGMKEPSAAKHTLRRLVKNVNREEFILLLSHKPHYFENYLEADLILSGHAHGGQMRLPWIGGIVAPGKAISPNIPKASTKWRMLPCWSAGVLATAIGFPGYSIPRSWSF